MNTANIQRPTRTGATYLILFGFAAGAACLYGGFMNEHFLTFRQLIGFAGLSAGLVALGGGLFAYDGLKELIEKLESAPIE